MNVRPITSGVLLLFVLSACDYPGVCYDRVLDGCRKAEDLAAFVAEQAAGSLASGNAIIGESGVLQATGKMSVSIRAHGAARSAPQLQGTMLRTDGVATSSTFRTEDGGAMSMSADFAVGGLRGFRAGETRIGGVDLLGNLSMAPGFHSSGLRVTSKGLGYGLGLRVGVIAETRVLPAISLSVMRRALPTFSAQTTQLNTDAGGTMSITLRDIAVTAQTLRLAGSKQFGRFGITGGFGQSSYETSAEYRVASPDLSDDSGENPMFASVTRRDMFAGASLTLGPARIGAEVGRTLGTSGPVTFNTFGDGATGGRRTYATLGVRFGAGRTHDRGR
jgi:hypothetical protein